MWDAHCHLTIKPAVEFADRLLETSREKSIKLSICSVNLEDHKLLSQFRKDYKENLYHIGLHPWSIREDEDIRGACRSILKNLDSFDGVGEVGLDFLKYKNTRNIQIEFLRELLFGLKKQDKPMVYHCVKAHNELLAMDFTASCNIIHGFYGSIELARRYLDLGFYFSLGHLYLNSKRDDVVKYIPIDKLLVETDSPSQLNSSQSNSVFPFRSPLDIEKTYDYFSSLRGMDKEELVLQVNENMRSIYKKS